MFGHALYFGHMTPIFGLLLLVVAIKQQIAAKKLINFIENNFEA